MIEVERFKTYGWESCIYGMRNPMNSWDKMDTDFSLMYNGVHAIGTNDLDLMKRLCRGGSDDRKFLRQIFVTCDITAPLYWVAEFDTYKVGTTKNSCSFMHRGVSKPFNISDFSVQDTRIQYLLSDLKVEKKSMLYPYETDEYKEYTTKGGRKYKVFRNGRIFACPFTYTDTWGTGRTRTFEEKEVFPSQTASGYFEINLGGSERDKWQIHRLVATLWKKDKYFEGATVDHIDGNKCNNSAENLQWVSLSENIKKAFKDGTYKENILHSSYKKWKRGFTRFDPFTRDSIRRDKNNGLSYKELQDKYGVTKRQIANAFYSGGENEELFLEAYEWETIIKTLNEMRGIYLETKDNGVFQAIRQLLPCGYNQRFTWSANYEVLRNIYHARKSHKLDEWRDFCKEIEKLPYAKELIIGDE